MMVTDPFYSSELRDVESDRATKADRKYMRKSRLEVRNGREIYSVLDSKMHFFSFLHFKLGCIL